MMPPKHVSIPCCSSCSFKQSLISFCFLSQLLPFFLSRSHSLFLALCVAYLWLSHFANGISFYDKWLVIIKVARSAVFGPAASNMQASPLAAAAAAAQWPQQQNAKETERVSASESEYRKLIMCSRRHCCCCCCYYQPCVLLSCSVDCFLSYGWMTFAKCLRAVRASCPGQLEMSAKIKRKKENNTHKKRKRKRK